jgi:hypothetical protein
MVCIPLTPPPGAARSRCGGGTANLGPRGCTNQGRHASHAPQQPLQGAEDSQRSRCPARGPQDAAVARIGSLGVAQLNSRMAASLSTIDRRFAVGMVPVSGPERTPLSICV